jgi:hypothetical protein
MASHIGRRKFLATLGGAAASAWPLAASAQQPERMRRIGVLVGMADDAEGQSRIAAFRQQLQALGWVEGGKVEFNYRWRAADPEQVVRRRAAGMGAGRDTEQLDADDRRAQQGNTYRPDCVCKRRRPSRFRLR